MTRMIRFFPSVFMSFLILFSVFATMAAEVQSSSPEKDLIRIGYSSSFFLGVDKSDVQVALDLWTRELVKLTPLKAEPVALIFDNLTKMAEALHRQEVDFVAMPFLDYLKIRQGLNLEPVLMGTKNGRVGEEYALIVHRSAPWTEVKQLRGKKLLVQEVSGASATSLLWLDTVLLHQGLPVSTTFFHPLSLVNKPSQAILPIFFKQADVCLVPLWAYDTMVELNPQVGAETKIITRSPTLPRGALFMQKGISAQKQTVIESALKVGSTAKSKQLLTLFNSENLVRYQPKYLESIVALYKDYNSLLRKN
jgi:ABC-type phosphate/phosphonate transport system substrate-binding protein